MNKMKSRQKKSKPKTELTPLPSHPTCLLSLQHADIVEAIEDAGFDAELLKVDANGPAAEASSAAISHVVKARFKIGGMTCSACVNSVEGALRAFEGVKSAQVALATEEAQVDYDTRVIGPQ